MLSAPGETQVFFRRPGDPPQPLSIRLGSSTWVNEPILQTLQVMAPKVEALDVAGWAQTHGEPPLQVVCVTDGQDNRSPSELRDLNGLVSAIKDIVGPRGNQVYRPMADPRERCKKDAIVGSGATQVPVWLCWLAMGSAGQQFLKAAQGQLSAPPGVSAPRGASKDLTIVSAVLPGGVCDVTITSCSSSAAVAVGSRVFVKRPTWESREPLSLVPANQIREAIVVKVLDSSLTTPEMYTVLYDDGVEETDVDSTRFAFYEEPPSELGADMIMGLCLVEAATTEPCSLMRLDNPNIWKDGEPEKILAKAGMKPAVLERMLRAKLQKSDEMVGLKLSLSPPPEGFLQKFMASVGASAPLLRWNAQERALGQRIMYATLMQLAQGCIVYSNHIAQACGDWCRRYAAQINNTAEDLVVQNGLTGRALESWKEDLAVPTLQALNFLVAEQVLQVSEVVIDCEREDCARCKVSTQKAFVLLDASQGICALSALTAVCRFSTPTWDALNRCCKHHHGPWHRRRQPESPSNSTRHRPALANQELLVKSGSVPHITGMSLAQCGLRRHSLKDPSLVDASKDCQSMVETRSAGTIERYRRRKSPVLWGAKTVNRSCLQHSGQLCLGNVETLYARDVLPSCLAADVLGATDLLPSCMAADSQ